MKDVFDDDDDMDDEAEIALLEAANKATSEKAATERKAQAERESKLRQMMEIDDEDDEAMVDAHDSPDSVVDDSPALDVPSAQPESVETSVVHNGRRRGRRRVMKKKTYTDEEGYLVTREEAEWESFSEDEPVMKQASGIQATASSKKKPQTKGQGNIMSFFGKK
jgi:DNA polymerase delta subunit 3